METNPSTLSLFEHIRSAKARYCRCLDTKQWGAFAELLVSAPEIRIFNPAGEVMASFDSREAFLRITQDFLAGAQSIHQVHNDELTRVSDVEIRAIWSMEDRIVFPQASSERLASMHGYGHYHETWVRAEGAWRIARLELRRTLLETTTRQGTQP